jgi:intracellular multiplication protein IcmC
MDKFLKGFLGLAGVLAAGAASAAGGVDTVGASAEQMAGNLPAIVDLISAGAYVGGVAAFLKCLALLKEHGDARHGARVGLAFVWGAVSTLLLALPGFASMMVESFALAEAALPSYGASSAVEGKDLATMAQSLAGSAPGIKLLVSAFGMVAGLWLLVRAVSLLPQVSEGRVLPSKPIWYLISGTALWSLLPFLDVITGTMGAGASGSNILASGFAATQGLATPGGGEQFDATIKACLTIIQLVGLVAFVRGGLLLKSIGDGKSDEMGRALTHLLGGAACINITWAVSTLATTLGMRAAVCKAVAAACGL